MSRLIKRYTGKNLVQLLTGLKMKRAQELLLHTGLRIDEVAEDGSIFEDQIIFPVSLSGCLVCRPEVTDAEKTVDCYELFHIFSSIFI